MAIKSTVFKAELQISDMDRNYYHGHELTLARHPSETDERMMLRLLAFSIHASEHLAFTRGISSQDEPDIWEKDLTGEIALWIDLGQPDEKRLRKACGRARSVYVYSYADRAAEIWREQSQPHWQRFDNLGVRHLPETQTAPLATMAQRNMQLQCTIQDGEIWFGDGQSSTQIRPVVWKAPAA